MRAVPAVLLPALAAAALAAAGARADDSLRCDGGLVSLGDSKLDLLGKCGEPALKDAHRVAHAVASGGKGAPLERREVSCDVERWTYDFGERRFTYTVTLELGKVIAIERGGYGYARGGPRPAVRLPRARCEPGAIREGDGALDLLARCGDPALRDEEEIVRTAGRELAEGEVAVARTTVRVEVWTYDFGPSTLVRRVRLEDGKIVRVETGGRGYAD